MKTMADSCDWKAQRKAKGEKALKPRLLRHRGQCSWSGIRTERYKRDNGTWSDVIRKTLIGMHGEKTRFHLRYFEVAPGGKTSLERHRHEHVVICIRGEGKCLVDNKTFALKFLDTVYIPPDAPHRLINQAGEPFGFFCIVDARRDRPRPVRERAK